MPVRSSPRSSASSRHRTLAIFRRRRSKPVSSRRKNSQRRHRKISRCRNLLRCRRRCRSFMRKILLLRNSRSRLSRQRRSRLHKQGPQSPPGTMSISGAKALAISSPRPEYPYEARSRHITGSGVCVVSVDVASGSVTDASMAQSIGNPILDNAAMSAFKRWRFKPGSVSKVKIPITFTMSGASY